MFSIFETISNLENRLLYCTLPGSPALFSTTGTQYCTTNSCIHLHHFPSYETFSKYSSVLLVPHARAPNCNQDWIPLRSLCTVAWVPRYRVRMLASTDVFSHTTCQLPQFSAQIQYLSAAKTFRTNYFMQQQQQQQQQQQHIFHAAASKTLFWSHNLSVFGLTLSVCGQGKESRLCLDPLFFLGD